MPSFKLALSDEDATLQTLKKLPVVTGLELSNHHSSSGTWWPKIAAELPEARGQVY